MVLTWSCRGIVEVLEHNDRRVITMDQSTTIPQARHFTAQASLAGLGVLLRQRDVFAPIRARVHSAQKTVTHTPLDKRYDGFSAIVAGAHGLVEINTRRRRAAGLQRAMGRTDCAASLRSRRWTPARRRRWRRWRGRSTRSIASTGRAIATAMRGSGHQRGALRPQSGLRDQGLCRHAAQPARATDRPRARQPLWRGGDHRARRN